MHIASRNPLPLSARQLAALARAAARQLTWGQPAVAREAARWRRRAEQIPDEPLRRAALGALETKRGHTDGAALFATIPRRRNAALVRALVTVELIWDYLDSVHELAPGEANGRQLHRALADAVDPGREPADWYRHHPCRDDGGYLAALVAAARQACASLPSFALVREPLAREMRRAQVLALNHLTGSGERDRALRAWAAEEFPGERELAWFELSGAASASLVVHALLTAGADPRCTPAEVERTRAAYWPWIALATTMLDSYADRAQDEASGDHSYIAHYPDEAAAVRRLALSIAEAACRALALPQGERHAVVVASMAALYLTKDSVRSARERPATRRLARAGGRLTVALVPVLRLWRLRYRQRAVS